MAAETLARFARAGAASGWPIDDQRRRRRRDGRRRGWRWRACALRRPGAADAARSSTRCCRRPGRTAIRSTSSATPRSSATREALQALLADREADAVLFLHAPTAIVRSAEIAARLRAAGARGAPSRVLSVLARRRCRRGGARASSRDAGMADYETPEEAVRALRCMLVQLPAQPGVAAARRRPRAAERSAPTLARGPRDRRSGARATAATCSTRPRPRRCCAPTAFRSCATRRGRARRPTRRARRRSIGYPGRAEDPVAATSATSPTSAASRSTSRRATAVARRRRAMRAARARARVPRRGSTGFTVQQMVRRPLAQRTDRRRQHRPGVRPGASCSARAARRSRCIADRAIGAAAAERVARARPDRAHARREAAGRLSRPPAGATRCDLPTSWSRLSQMVADLPELAELDINPLLADARRRHRARCTRRVMRSTPAGRRRSLRDPAVSRRARARRSTGTASAIVRCARSGPRTAAALAPSSSARAASDLRLRFFCARRELPRSELARLTQIDYDAGDGLRRRSRPDADGHEETLGVVRADLPTRTTSTRSSRSSSAPTSRAAASAICCSTR